MIRQATEEDLKWILEIYNDAIINTTAVYEYKAYSLEDRKVWYNKKMEKGYPVLVFEEEGKILGFATFGPFRERPAYKYTIEHSVYVDRSGRNKGIGTALMQEIIKTADERGFATLVAGIDGANEQSIKIHEKLGFKYSGTIERAGYKFGKWLNLVFYQLDLKGPKIPVEE
ncbi:GCN5-like N-acetyltransferase [Clostridium aceticum]|uniref:GCN5-like N-acetyltransferase n=1 Tax=Clostridium aceticum TaxID=84022 RepID=A0A0D8IC88_9CLOT|nr:GNAT family N-acetyltransferase [Clostridium aceticum]AKL94773.1 GCN5-like N-acetyltransferase [Clostridium aceticum]KJF27719.1 phosphinothricin acetyltransferase [Clostridium aceticum]